jgi:Fur family ferric uptake transcriptional regulator/Fur family peroxide stress response transcriptional regulator
VESKHYFHPVGVTRQSRYNADEDNETLYHLISLMLRQTKQRQAILEAVEQSHDHPTAAQVYERVRRVLPGVGFATVYRNLGGLAEEGMIRELCVGEVTQYDRRTDRHDHAICRQCKKLVDVVVPLPAEVIEAVLEPSGFQVAGYHTEVFGLCSECR